MVANAQNLPIGVEEDGAPSAAYRYPARAIYADYLRSAAGVTCTAAPPLLLGAAAPVAALLLGFSGLFLWFGCRTYVRQRTRVVLDDAALRLEGLRPREVRWGEVEDLRLAYYTPRRSQRGAGWMHLTLKGGGTAIRLDSELPGFDAILRRALAAAAERGIELSATSRANLEALGLEPRVEPRPA
jgi:hypothetical protein